jgi:hypothetical protein
MERKIDEEREGGKARWIVKIESADQRELVPLAGEDHNEASIISSLSRPARLDRSECSLRVEMRDQHAGEGSAEKAAHWAIPDHSGTQPALHSTSDHPSHRS